MADDPRQPALGRGQFFDKPVYQAAVGLQQCLVQFRIRLKVAQGLAGQVLAVERVATGRTRVAARRLVDAGQRAAGQFEFVQCLGNHAFRMTEQGQGTRPFGELQRDMRSPVRRRHRRCHPHAPGCQVVQQCELEIDVEAAARADRVQARHIPGPIGRTQRVVVVQPPANQVALLHLKAMVPCNPARHGGGGGGRVGGEEIGVVFLSIGHRAWSLDGCLASGLPPRFCQGQPWAGPKA